MKIDNRLLDHVYGLIVDGGRRWINDQMSSLWWVVVIRPMQRKRSILEEVLREPPGRASESALDWLLDDGQAASMSRDDGLWHAATASDQAAASPAWRLADEGASTVPLVASSDVRSRGSGVQPTIIPSWPSSSGPRTERLPSDQPANLVHVLLGAGFGAMEASACRCMACSQLFVSETSATLEAGLAAAAVSLDLTFKLHSNPTANHRIYLDFDGHYLERSQWENGGSLELGAFYTSFTDTAKQAIQDIWRRVAEDFSPFNIDVTTEEPNSEDLKKSGSGDSRWGIRVALSTNRNLLTNAPTINGGGGGTAYLGSFNWATDEVCLVFNGYNSTSASSIYAAAETVSHEVGHTLGLNHDGGSSGSNPIYYEGHGSGITSWGPIMGGPFINADENVTTWSKGDYIGADNREDDLGVITGSVSNAYVSGNGFTYRDDDYGDSLVAAYALSGTAPSSFGIIERSTDVDWFRFRTGAGSIALSIRNACRLFSANGDGTFSVQYLDSLGPNLDISASIYNSSGTLIASSNPIESLEASFSLNLAAGDYYLAVEGVGYGDPLASPATGYTDYGSLGQYLISGTLIDQLPVGGLIVSPVSGLTTSESGGIASFSVALGAAPMADVLISVVSADESEGIASVSSLTFTSSNWATSQTVTVTGVDDSAIDGPVPYLVNLISSSSDSSYQGLSSSVSLTSLDNDLPRLSISSPSPIVVEGQVASMLYTVSMDMVSPVAVSVAYATSNGTAIAGSDYTATSGTLSFAAGETSKTITVNLLNDSLNEADETFSLSLSAPSNAILQGPSGVTTTITDTLVATSSTQLPAGIENLRLVGSAPINGTGNSGANAIIGNDGVNVLKGGGNLDLLTGLLGVDSFDLSGINNAANRCRITDFDALTGETIRLSNSLTSRSGALSLTTVRQASEPTLNTSSFDVFAFNFNNLESDVNLDNSTAGNALLDGLNSASGSARLKTSRSGGAGYIVAYDNGNAYLYAFSAGRDDIVSSSEIALIGILDSTTAIAVGALRSVNFVLV